LGNLVSVSPQPERSCSLPVGTDAEAWRRDGYFVRQALLQEGEIDELRRRALALARRFHGDSIIDKPIPVDLLSEPLFRPLVLDPRILGLARDLVGPRLVYCGDSKITIMSARGRFHKDSSPAGIWPSPRGYDPFDSREGPYDQLRIMIYLQDHRRYAGNLRVRRGSHAQPVVHYVTWPRDLVFWMSGRLKRFPGLPRGKRLNLNTAPGDVVAFNLRVSHGVNAVRLRGLPGLCLDPKVERFVPRRLRAPELRERIAVLITLGAPGVHLERYIQSRMERFASNDRFRKATFDSPEIREQAERAGLELRFDLIRPSG
jgi:Phytanoyl-CoA dioxygenase (PhyH)